MPRHFRSIRLDVQRSTPLPRSRGLAAPSPDASDAPAGGAAPSNDEGAARFYLEQLFSADDSAAANSLLASDAPAVVPDLRLTSIRRTPAPRPSATARDIRGEATSEMDRPGATLVSFVQTSRSVPIFGSRANVTMDADRSVLAARADVAPPPDVHAVASVSPSDALRSIAREGKADSRQLASVAAPRLEYFQDENTEAWHLVYHFAMVPALTRDDGDQGELRGHGLGLSPREFNLQFDYLVDANDGQVVFTYSSNPTAVPMVTKCGGIDELGLARDFYAVPDAGAYQMHDPLRSIRTFDLAFGDIEGAFPTKPIVSTVVKPWKDSGAVSAHFNAMNVQQFYYDVLGRHSIDDQGMELVSVVNCTYSKSQEPSPRWTNAVWYNDRMWYGQTADAKGVYHSFSRLLDVIGHELTHGVTAHTAALVYRDLSGALNESFSDIFGVIINNWFTVGSDSDVATWSWKIGDGLRAGGRPLRDMSNPASLGYPAHMRDYTPTTRDNGGVHTFSNIHNLAAYNVLTAAPVRGRRAISARDAAVLYYMTLQRLGSLATFSDARAALVDSATIYFGDLAERAAALTVIAAAYDAVGIP